MRGTVLFVTFFLLYGKIISSVEIHYSSHIRSHGYSVTYIFSY